MATTRITSTRQGLSALDYATQQGKPHNDDNPNVNRRVLQMTCLNCSVGSFKDQMQAVWSANHTKRNKRIELYRITQSFGKDELDIDDTANYQRNINLANRAGYALARKLYPDRQVVVTTQADGKNHMIHNHIDVVNPDFVEGKALRGKRTNQGYIAKVSDEAVQSVGIKLSSKTPQIKKDQLRTKSSKVVHSNQQNRAKKGHQSFIEKIQSVITDVSSDSDITNLDEFHDECKKQGLDVKFRKRKSGKISGISYKLDNGEMKKAVRAKRLGSDFQLEYLNQLFFDHEKKKQSDHKRVKDVQDKQRQSKIEQNKDDSARVTQIKSNSAKPVHRFKKRPKLSLNKKRSQHSTLDADLDAEMLKVEYEQSKGDKPSKKKGFSR